MKEHFEKRYQLRNVIKISFLFMKGYQKKYIIGLFLVINAILLAINLQFKISEYENVFYISSFIQNIVLGIFSAYIYRDFISMVFEERSDFNTANVVIMSISGSIIYALLLFIENSTNTENAVKTIISIVAPFVQYLYIFILCRTGLYIDNPFSSVAKSWGILRRNLKSFLFLLLVGGCVILGALGISYAVIIVFGKMLSIQNLLFNKAIGAIILSAVSTIYYLTVYAFLVKKERFPDMSIPRLLKPIN
jgi:hypothetical protein